MYRLAMRRCAPSKRTQNADLADRLPVDIRQRRFEPRVLRPRRRSPVLAAGLPRQVRDHRGGRARIQRGGDHARRRQEQKFAVAGGRPSAAAPPGRPPRSRPPARSADPGRARTARKPASPRGGTTRPPAGRIPTPAAGNAPRPRCTRSRSLRSDGAVTPPSEAITLPRGSVTRKSPRTSEILRPQLARGVADGGLVAGAERRAHVRHAGQHAAHAR